MKKLHRVFRPVEVARAVRYSEVLPFGGGFTAAWLVTEWPAFILLGEYTSNLLSSGHVLVSDSGFSRARQAYAVERWPLPIAPVNDYALAPLFP